MSVELWLPVDGYEGLYEAGDLGHVRSVRRIVVNNGGAQVRGGMVLKTFLNRYGYPCVKLSREGKSSARPVHVLVATAFVPRPEWATQVRHLDGDHANAAATNLLWGTQAQNELDKRAHGSAVPTFLPHDRCLREHLLVPPNVIEADGRHRCLACKRGRSDVRDAWRRRGEVLDVAERADHHYRLIMEGVAA